MRAGTTRSVAGEPSVGRTRIVNEPPSSGSVPCDALTVKETWAVAPGEMETLEEAGLTMKPDGARVLTSDTTAVAPRLTSPTVIVVEPPGVRSIEEEQHEAATVAPARTVTVEDAVDGKLVSTTAGRTERV